MQVINLQQKTKVIAPYLLIHFFRPRFPSRAVGIAISRYCTFVSKSQIFEGKTSKLRFVMKFIIFYLSGQFVKVFSRVPYFRLPNHIIFSDIGTATALQDRYHLPSERPVRLGLVVSALCLVGHALIQALQKTMVCFGWRWTPRIFRSIEDKVISIEACKSGFKFSQVVLRCE